jgi:hypothetical protein
MRFSSGQHMKAADVMEKLSEEAIEPALKSRRMKLAITHRILALKAEREVKERTFQVSVHELMTLACKHWTAHLPDKVKELQAEGMLEAETNAAANLAQSEIETLMKAGYQEHEAREVALPMFILLKPEYREDEQDRELAEMEAEWRRNPRAVFMDADPDDEYDYVGDAP